MTPRVHRDTFDPPEPPTARELAHEHLDGDELAGWYVQHGVAWGVVS